MARLQERRGRVRGGGTGRPAGARRRAHARCPPSFAWPSSARHGRTLGESSSCRGQPLIAGAGGASSSITESIILITLRGAESGRLLRSVPRSIPTHARLTVITEPAPAGARRRDHGWMSGGRVLGVDACRAGWVGIALPGDGQIRPYFAPAIRNWPGGPPRTARCRSSRSTFPSAWPIPGGGARTSWPGKRSAAAGRPCSSRRSARRCRRPTSGRPGREPAAAPGRASPARRSPCGPRSSTSTSGSGESPPSARVVEAHPELSFAALAGAPLRSRKTTWAGAVQRRTLLAQAGHRPGRRPRPGRGAGGRGRRARRGRGGLDRPAGQPGRRALPAPTRPRCSATGCPLPSGPEPSWT